VAPIISSEKVLKKGQGPILAPKSGGQISRFEKAPQGIYCGAHKRRLRGGRGKKNGRSGRKNIYTPRGEYTINKRCENTIMFDAPNTQTPFF